MITLAHLQTRFDKDNELAELTDREHSTTIDVDVVNAAIRDAESEAESYLNATGLIGRNALGELVYLKSSIVPDMLIGKICDMARWYLHEDQMLDIVQKRYDGAIAWLKMVMKNPAMLTGVSQSEESSNAVSGVFVIPNPVPNKWID